MPLRQSSTPSRNLIEALAVAILVCGAPAVADEIDVNVGGDALRLGYVRTMRATGLELDFSYINSDEADVAAVGLHVVDLAPGSNSWLIGLGGKVYYFDVDADFLDGTALGLGGHVRYRWPGIEALELGGSLHWAPGAAAFQEAEEFLEAEVRLAYSVIERGTMYIGARTVVIDFEGRSSRTVDNVHIGFRILY